MDEAPASAGVRRRRMWIAIAGVVVAVALLAYVFNGRFGQNPRLVDSPLIGQPLPSLTLDYLEQDGALDFSELKGQIVVINFWASWCLPCRAEHPILTAASEAFEGRGVHFVGIVYQDREGPAVGFLDEFGRGTNYSYVNDVDSRATIELGVFGVPETYFVDAAGAIRAKVQGQVDAVALIQTIEDLLAGRDPSL